MSDMRTGGLKKTLGFFSLTNIVVGNMIGAGIFTTSGLMLAQVHNPILLLILWAIGGVIALCGALSYSELGANFPRAGGDFVFLSELFSPLLGFVNGWTTFIAGFSAPMAAIALAFSEYLIRTFPEGSGPEQLELIKKAIAIGIILVFALIHYMGLHSGSKVQNLLSMLKIVLILVLLVAGFAFGEGSFQHFRVETQVAGGWPGLKAMGLTLMWIMFAYTGWNASTYVGSEIINPLKNIPRSLISGTLLVMLSYIALNALFVYAIPTQEMEGVISVGGLASSNLFNRAMDQFFSLFIAIILLSAISVLTIIGPRVTYAMAESGLFFGIAKKVNRSGVPGISILLQSGLAVLFVLTGSFEQIITLLSFSLGIFPIIAVMGVFKLRMKGKTALKMPAYPYVQIFFILISLLILVLTFLERPKESSIATGAILMGIPAYYLLRKQNRR